MITRRTFISFLYIALLFSFGCKPQKIEKNNKVQEKTNPSQIFDTIESIGELYQYFNANPKSLLQKEENSIIESLAEKSFPCYRHPTGLYYRMLEKGTTTKYMENEMISAHYTGKLLNGEKFDSSYDRNKPIQFKKGEMIKGWNLIIPYMTKESRIQLYLPSSVGYGEQGFSTFVPPNSILVFEIEWL